MNTNTATKTSPRLYARDMLTAQSIVLTAAQRADLKAKADRFREITGTTDRTHMNVPVYDTYAPEVQIGQITYTNL